LYRSLLSTQPGAAINPRSLSARRFGLMPFATVH